MFPLQHFFSYHVLKRKSLSTFCIINIDSFSLWLNKCCDTCGRGWNRGCQCGTKWLKMILLRTAIVSATVPRTRSVPEPSFRAVSKREQPLFPIPQLFAPLPLGTVFQSHWAKNSSCCNEVALLGVSEMKTAPDHTHLLLSLQRNVSVGAEQIFTLLSRDYGPLLFTILIEFIY